MRRYFFHLRDGDTLVQDEEGQEFSDLEAVRLEATASAREILSEAARTGTAGSLHLQIEVADEAGRTILTVPAGRVTGTVSQS